MAQGLMLQVRTNVVNMLAIAGKCSPTYAIQSNRISKLNQSIKKNSH